MKQPSKQVRMLAIADGEARVYNKWQVTCQPAEFCCQSVEPVGKTLMNCMVARKVKYRLNIGPEEMALFDTRVNPRRLSFF
jgi:hypothetical protein